MPDDKDELREGILRGIVGRHDFARDIETVLERARSIVTVPAPHASHRA